MCERGVIYGQIFQCQNSAWIQIIQIYCPPVGQWCLQLGPLPSPYSGTPRNYQKLRAVILCFTVRISFFDTRENSSFQALSLDDTSMPTSVRHCPVQSLRAIADWTKVQPSPVDCFQKLCIEVQHYQASFS